MSYLGLNPQTQLLNTSSQNFSGNGVATQFSLTRNVATASDLDIIIGNVAQRPFVDYVAGNVSLVFTTPPGAGANNITVTYRAGALNSLDLSASAFQSGTVGAPSVYSLAANNTGIYWSGPTSINFTAAGTDVASFNYPGDSVNSTTGALTVLGGIGATGNINTAGLVRITNVETSTSTSTGAVIVSGGQAIVGNLNVGGDITCVGDFTVNGTFTTTGTDSLSVADPFIFLANANPGDTYDTGVVSQYYDGSNTRYTGYFRDITVDKYKLFGNLLTEPTNTVDTTDPSFQYQDLILANLSATGNVNGTYFIGNGAALTGISTGPSNSIVNTNSTVVIPAVNGNIIANVNSNTIAVVAAAGIYVTGLISATGNVTTTANVSAGNIATSGIISATGNITSSANVIGANLVTGGFVSSTGNVIAANLNAAGLSLSSNVVSAINSTSDITTTANISAGNILGGANVNATTHTGTTVSVSGTITGGNVVFGSGNVSGTGNVLGGNLVASANVSSVGISASGNITVGNVLTGGLISAAGNITGASNISGGNLLGGGLSLSSNVISALNVTPNIAGGNITTPGLISAVGNITGGNLNAAGLSLSSNVVSAINSTSNITTTANISGGNVLGGANVNATTHTGTTVSVTGTVTAASVVGGVMTGSSISVTGAVTGAGITGTSLTVSTGAVTLGSIVNANANGVGNIGAVGGFFNTVFAKATSAQYADLAEYYAADADYPPGTVLSFGGNNEVTITTIIGDARVAGVVSTNPAHAMNAGIDAEHSVALALAGRVPTMVVGRVCKGDMMVSAGGGRAQACATPVIGTVIGKALENHQGGQGVIEVVVGKL